MNERTTPLAEAAERCGVSRRTLKVWIREAGFNLPPRKSKGRYTILVYDWMIEKLQAERSPQIARVSGVQIGKEARSSAHAGSPAR